MITFAEHVGYVPPIWPLRPIIVLARAGFLNQGSHKGISCGGLHARVMTLLRLESCGTGRWAMKAQTANEIKYPQARLKGMTEFMEFAREPGWTQEKIDIGLLKKLSVAKGKEG